MGSSTEFIAANEEELRARYPTWKIPRDAPVPRKVENPLNGQIVEILSFDPDSSRPVPRPRDAGQAYDDKLPTIDLGGCDAYEIEGLIRLLHAPSEAIVKRFGRPALIGPPDGPWIYECPASFMAKLAALPNESSPSANRAPPAGKGAKEKQRKVRTALPKHLQTVDAVAQAWILSLCGDAPGGKLSKASRDSVPRYTEWLIVLVDFARLCVLTDRRMYLWQSP